MSLIRDLIEAAPTLPTSSKFTVLSGIIYMASGILFMVWPGSVQTLLLDPDFVGNEASLLRLLGMTVAVIGWLYLFGGRSGGRQVVAATVVDRIFLVPLVLVPTAMASVFPHLLLTFAILDPLLAAIAWYLLARERR